jgi:protein-S-isoprenylcysteine O-methyltransferase Ste14
MTRPFAIAFFTLAVLGPVPLWHLLLHGLLPTWRKSPRAVYLLAAPLWIGVAPVWWRLADSSPQLFAPRAWGAVVGFSASVGGLLVFLWSLWALTPRRFFAWVVLRPGDGARERVVRGPYRYAAHPGYLALVATVSGHFLASGQAVLLWAALGMSVLLGIIAVLEQRELRERLKGPTSERDQAPSPLSPVARD